MDIPEKEISDQNLKESEEICKGLFNESPLSMVLIDLNGRIIDCNPAQEKIFGSQLRLSAQRNRQVHDRKDLSGLPGKEAEKRISRHFD